MLQVYDWVQKNWTETLAFLYAAALFGTHVFPANTVAYKLCSWLLAGKQR